MTKSELRAQIDLLLANSTVEIRKIPENVRGVTAWLSDMLIKETQQAEWEAEAEQVRRAEVLFAQDYYAHEIDEEEELYSTDPLNPLPERQLPKLHDEYDMVARLRECHLPFGDAECFRR